jgi:hypothetical protein
MRSTATLAATVFLSFCGAASRADILLEQGRRYDFSFNALSLVGPSTGVDQAGFTAYLGLSNPLDPGDAVRVELFEDAFTGTPFYSYQFTTPTTLFAATIVSPTAWHDFQGGLSFTMLSGTMNLDRLQARVIINHELYEADVNLLPEPPMIGLALLVLASARRRRRDR